MVKLELKMSNKKIFAKMLLSVLISLLIMTTSTCGKPTKSPKTHFVLDGLLTEFLEFRFMVALGWPIANTTQYDYKCGGALISPYFILTAAHCTSVGGLPPSVALPGGVNLRKTKALPYPIDMVYRYPYYNSVTSYHDIALLRLAVPINQFTPIAIATNFRMQGSTVVAIGYGNTVYAGKPSDELLKTPLTVVGNRVCQEYYNGFADVPFGMHSRQICAVDRKFRRDTCQGDSGGPLVYYSQIPGGSIPLLVGVTSFGQGCATNSPGVYVRVPRYVNWIVDIAFS